MNSSVPPKILVVGGGPSGLVLALTLLKNGIPVRVIEKNPEPRVGQRGAGIMPRSLELFSALGVVDKILESAIQVPRVRKYELPGGVNPIQEFEMASYTNPTPAYPFMSPVLLGQDHLEKILHDALLKYSCKVELGTELVEFEQVNEQVNVKLVHRADASIEGRVETASYDWMIGADGARGVVRKMLGLSFLGETRVETLVVGDIHVEGLSQDYWHMWGEAGSALLSFRPTEVPTLFNLIVAGQDVDHSHLSSDEDILRKYLIEQTGGRSDLNFAKVPWLSHYTPSIRMVDKFGEGRVFVAGDAAHVHSPTGGQGMNTGVQDSFNLAWKLALVQRGLSPSSLLHTYTEERLPVIAEMLVRTTKILNRTLEEKSNDPWKRTGSLLQLGVNCRRSSIVMDEQEHADFDGHTSGDEEKESENLVSSYGAEVTGVVRAGDRAPDAPGLVGLPTGSSNQSPRRRLFEVFGVSYHTVLIFSGATKECTATLGAIDMYPKETVRSVVVVQRGVDAPPSITDANFAFEDRDGYAHDGYGVPGDGGRGVIIIRPDGVIGAIVRGPQGLKRYFSRIFGPEKI